MEKEEVIKNLKIELKKYDQKINKLNGIIIEKNEDIENLNKKILDLENIKINLKKDITDLNEKVTIFKNELSASYDKYDILIKD